jgi:hypothetical protein
MRQTHPMRTRRQIYRVIRIPGQGWCVVDEHDGRVSGTYGNKDSADTVCNTMTAAFEAKAKRQDRPCMCCGTMFPSVGIHNRMCDPCRRRPDVDISPNSIARARR